MSYFDDAYHSYEADSCVDEVDPCLATIDRMDQQGYQNPGATQSSHQGGPIYPVFQETDGGPSVGQYDGASQMPFYQGTPDEVLEPMSEPSLNFPPLASDNPPLPFEHSFPPPPQHASPPSPPSTPQPAKQTPPRGRCSNRASISPEERKERKVRQNKHCRKVFKVDKAMKEKLGDGTDRYYVALATVKSTRGRGSNGRNAMKEALKRMEGDGSLAKICWELFRVNGMDTVQDVQNGPFNVDFWIACWNLPL